LPRRGRGSDALLTRRSAARAARERQRAQSAGLR
jgi:hypothetical protein